MRGRVAWGAALATQLVAAVVLAALVPAGAHAAVDPGPVTGRVLGADGSPLAGVVVRMTAYGEYDPVAETTSAADGTFSLPGADRPPAFVLVACSDDDACDDVWHATDLVKTFVGPGEQAHSLALLHGYFTTDADPATADPAVDAGDVRMVRPGTVRVVDDSGQRYPQLSGITISGLTRQPGNHRLVWRMLAPGIHQVDAGDLHRTVRVASGQVRTIRLTDRPAVAGRVAVGGRPVRGDHVVVDLPSTVDLASARTDRHGRYRLGPLPAHQRLIVRIGVRHYAYLEPDNLPKRVEAVTLRPGEVHQVSIAARRGSLGALGLSVAPIGFQVVTLRTPAGLALGQLPVEHGRARTGGLPPGRYVLTTTWHTSTGDGGFDTDVDVRGLHIRPGHTTRLRLAPQRGPGDLTAYADPGTFVRVRAAGTERVLHARTVGDTGKVAFTGLPVGDYDVTAARDSLGATESAPASVHVGRSPADVTPPAPPAPGSVRLRPVDPDTGQPWPWTPEMAGYLGGCGGLARLDDAGFYAGAAEPGTYRDCGVRFVWLEKGTPEYRPGGAYPVQGTLVVRPGEETTGDVAIDLTPPD
ncbi:MAG: hypothetical protein H6529_01685 [Nocardioides sp.]|nr:hypothetical protein [Nocardioides sp.]